MTQYFEKKMKILSNYNSPLFNEINKQLGGLY